MKSVAGYIDRKEKSGLVGSLQDSDISKLRRGRTATKGDRRSHWWYKKKMVIQNQEKKMFPEGGAFCYAEDTGN